RREPPTSTACGARRHRQSSRCESACTRANGSTRRSQMLHYAIVFFVIALIAALFGFTGIAASAAGIAKILFIVFLVVGLVTLLLGQRRRISSWLPLQS